MLRITSAQINFTVGDISGNLEKMVAAAVKAQSEQSDLLVFSELSLTGYYPFDLLEDEVFLRNVDAGYREVLRISRDLPSLSMVVGLPRRRTGPGKQLTNSLVVVRDGVEVMSYSKQLLPTYGIFDERRHFEPGPDRSCVITVAGTKVGLLICEDGWNSEGHDYAINPFSRLRDASPDVIVSINASPSNIGKREQRHAVFGRAVAENRIPLLYVNQIGGHDQLVYDGASFALVPHGNGYRIQFEAARFEEDVQTLTFDNGQFGNAAGEELPRVPVAGLPTMEFYRRQIVLGVKDYARRCGFTKAVVGSSGGIDSALTLALAVEALGAENVVAITMPSRYSSAGSVSDSEVLCNNLGVKLLSHSIKGVVEQYEAGFQDATSEPLQGLARENLQARVRGSILMEYSNSFGHLLLTTGNKSEIGVGYCTLYGDTNGGLGLIGDLWKTEVFALSRHVNAVAGRELIPMSIIDKAPSAELAPDQKDTDSLPPYEVLDDVLRVLIEGPALATDERLHAQLRVNELMSTEDGQALVERVRKMIARNEYKRRQMPPVIRVRSRAFGSGRQMPIAAKVA
ncbi:NAD+ synthase [Burkholderia cenocepacia]|uniref:NAD+ synthase n=1 Tax=Burkholderia cenocepacia TaxID=95486 RepID=UPI000761D08F|nr:NAD+ synthase [Burkholderia cenocepacia]KWU19263.1 NAD+ synthetase [Burkholderia cenocepacia]